MKKRILISVLFLTPLLWRWAGAEVFAQNHNIDSLLTLINTDKPDTNKVNHFYKLSREYINTGEYGAGLKYGNKALALARSLVIGNNRGWAKGEALAYNNIGLVYYYQGNNLVALKNLSTALNIREKIGNKRDIANSLSNIGMIYCNQGNYPLALKKYFAALKLREEIKDLEGIAGSYSSIGSIYYFQDNYLEALKNYFAALKISEDIGDKKGIAGSYNNIGNIYKDQGNYSNALKNQFASLKIREELGDKEGIADSYNNIGIIYFFQGDYPVALKNHFASLKISEEIGNQDGIVSSFINLSVAKIKLNKLTEAQDYLNKALKLGIELGSKKTIMNSYAGQTLLDSAHGNWKEAYLHHKLFIVYRDSIDNEETKKKTIESSMNYDFEKKEAASKAEQDKKDTITEANKKKQQLVLLLVSCVLLLVFIFAGFVVRSLRITQKQKNIIELQKNEVSLQKEMVSEKNKEITDSINYAQRIQRALLASDKMLNENFNSNSTTSPLYNWREGGAEVNYFIFFQPKDIVSGDFYWASPLANGNFALVTADSTGHGVPGAIMSMLNISCLNEAVRGHQLTAPDEILNYTRSKIIEHLSNDGSAEGGKDGMDCSLISIEHPSPSGERRGLRLTYSAANNSIWIVRKKQIIELEPDKMPVGKHERDKISFTQHTIELQKGDIVYTITDGYVDQFGGTKGKKFMAKQLKELLISISHLPMNEQKEKLTNEFNNWRGNLEQVDDVTIIGIRV